MTLGSLEKFLQDTVPRQIGIDLGSGKDQRPFADVRGFKASELVLAKVDPKNLQDQIAATVAPDPRVRQLEEWERVRSSRDIHILTEYQSQNPAGPFAEEAARRIESLEWESTKAANTPEAYRAFAERHPNRHFHRTSSYGDGAVRSERICR